MEVITASYSMNCFLSDGASDLKQYFSTNMIPGNLKALPDIGAVKPTLGHKLGKT